MAVYSPPDENEKIVSSHRRPDKIHFQNTKRRGMSRLCGAISMNGQKLEKKKYK